MKQSYFLLFFAFLSFFPLNQVLSIQNKEAIQLTEKEQDWLNQKHTVRVRVGHFPPIMFDENKVEGIAIEYLERIFSHHNIAYQYISGRDISWNQALEYIKRHEMVDMVPTAKVTELRKIYLSFTKEYLFMPWVIFVKEDSPFISGIEDLKGKSVCVPSGFVMHNLLKENYPEINLSVVTGTNLLDKCMQQLSSGLVDGYIGNLTAGTYLIHYKGYNNIKVSAPTPFGSHNQAMAIRKDWPELVGIINKTLAVITPSEHAQIKNQWMSVRFEYGIHPLDTLKWVLGVAGFLISILVFILLWNRRLNSEITTRKKMEANLRESEERFRALSNATFEGIVITNHEKILEANESMCRMFGYELSELFNMNASGLISPEDRDNIKNNITSGNHLPYESHFLKKDGTLFPVEVLHRLIIYKGKKVLVTAFRDLTEQKKAEEEIKTLHGILPICSFCKNIRNDDGEFEKIEAYIEKKSGMDLTHTICPLCMKEHYPEDCEA